MDFRLLREAKARSSSASNSQRTYPPGGAREDFLGLAEGFDRIVPFGELQEATFL